MKAVIFDVDGTLLDSVDQHAEAWRVAFEAYGHRMSFARIRSQIGKGGDQLLPFFLSEEEIENVGKAIEKYRGDFFKKNFLPDLKPFPKVRELFQCLLEDGWKLALASSAKKEELKKYEEICRITDLLETETSADDAEKSKPHPDIFQATIKRLKVSAKECLVVGDSPYDAEAAGKAGIRALGFLCGGFQSGDLLKAGCETLFEDAASVVSHYVETPFHRERPDRG